MLPGITREQMVLVDEIMVTELGVRIEMMMEHAGEALARHAVKCAQLTFEKTMEEEITGEAMVITGVVV